MQCNLSFLSQVIVGVIVVAFSYIITPTVVFAGTVYETGVTNYGIDLSRTGICCSGPDNYRFYTHVLYDLTVSSFDTISFRASSTEATLPVYLIIKTDDQDVSAQQIGTTVTDISNFNAATTEYGVQLTAYKNGNTYTATLPVAKTLNTNQFLQLLFNGSAYSTSTFALQPTFGFKQKLNEDGSTYTVLGGTIAIQLCDGSCDTWGNFTPQTPIECTDCTYIRHQTPEFGELVLEGINPDMYALYNVRSQDIVDINNVYLTISYFPIAGFSTASECPVLGHSCGTLVKTGLVQNSANYPVSVPIQNLTATGTYQVQYSLTEEKVVDPAAWWQFWADDEVESVILATDYTEFNYAEVMQWVERQAIITETNAREEQEAIASVNSNCLASNEAMANCVKDWAYNLLQIPPLGYLTRTIYILNNPATTTLVSMSLPMPSGMPLEGTTLSLDLDQPIQFLETEIMSGSATIAGNTRTYYEHMMYYWDLLWYLIFVFWVLYVLTGVHASVSGTVQSGASMYRNEKGIARHKQKIAIEKEENKILSRIANRRR